MRTLTAPLLAAQRSPSAVPHLKVTVSNRIGGIRRLAFSRLYTGNEADGYHAAAMPGDGSLLRARASGGRVYYQRVANPGSGSNFGSWTDLEAAANAGVALCAEGSRALLFFVDPGGTVLKVRESTDNGATLGAAVTAATASGAVDWLAADVKANGDALLFYSVGATVFSVKQASGVWGSAAAWTNGVASVSGLACYYQGDWNVVICQTNSAGEAFVSTAIFGDGFSQAANTWSTLREVTRASAGSNVAFRAPFLSQPDTYRLSFIEKYTGSAAYNRPYHSYSPATADFASNLWRESVPFDLASDFGQAIAFSATGVWLSTPSGVWSASLTATALDVTADVVEAETRDERFGGRCRIALRNDGGRYFTLPSQIKTGAEVRVSPGYATSSEPQVSDGPAYWVTDIERRSANGEATLVLEARDAWSLLSEWRARRQYAWTAGERNVFGILQFLFSRAGLEFSSSGSSATAANLYPAFTVHPGDSGLTAVRRLLTMVPHVIFVRGEFAFLTEPLASEATDYAYGTQTGAGDHAMLSGRYSDTRAEINRAQVFGSGVFGERFEWAGVQSIYDDLRQEHDRNLTTVALVESRADAMLRASALDALSGEITVPVNCGQELYDVIEVTDAGAGLSAARRRVVAMAMRYSTGKRSVFEQDVTLGAV